MLFDAHELDVAENLRQTTEVVAEARSYGAHVEGEIEGIQGVEDGIGSDGASVQQSLEVAVDFIKRTGVDCFAPAIGNAHGQYTAAPVLDHQRVTDLVEATGVPMALHGGTGLSPEQFKDLIARGCAKVNISTALKETYMKSSLEFLHGGREEGQVGPAVAVHRTSAPRSRQMAREHMQLSAARGVPGDGADLRLRRRAGRHRAVRPPAGLQRDLRRIRAAGPLGRGRVRASS